MSFASNLIRSTWPKVRSEKKNGLLGYVVDARGNGWSGKQKFYTRSKNKALKIAKLLAADYRELGVEAARFKIEDYAIYKTWTGLLNKTRQCFGQPDLSMDRIFEEYHSQKEARSRAALKKNAPSVQRAAKLYYEEKSAPLGGKGGKNLSNDSKRELRQTVKHLSTSVFGLRAVNAVTHSMIESYLKSVKRKDGKQLKQQSRKSRLTQFKMFFNWCKHPKREWISKNPCEGIQVYVEPKEVSILSNEDVERLLNASFADSIAKEKILPWLVLGLFAGLRPSEAERLYWEEIDWSTLMDDGALQIRIGTEKSKTKTHYAELHPTGVKWLKHCIKMKGKIGYSVRVFKRIRQQVGLYDGWDSDCIRHTYASNWLATYRHKGIHMLAELMGNSAEVIKRHYRRAIPTTLANNFWTILPPVETQDNAQKKAA